MKKRLLFIIGILCLSFVSADENHETNVENYYPLETMDVVLFAVVALVLFTLISVYGKEKLTETAKKVLFIVLVLIVGGTTLYLIGTTLYINSISITKGPIHWHADFEIWACGEKLDLVDPKGLSNKVGTPVFHEHDDDRIHVEGVVLEEQHVSLSSFFDVVGGSLTHTGMTVPTSDGATVTKQNGELCDGQSSEIQVFLYSVSNPKDHQEWRYSQQKLDYFEDYVLKDWVDVPPGDCIIIEFGPTKQTTENICTTYQVGIDKGHLTLE